MNININSLLTVISYTLIQKQLIESLSFNPNRLEAQYNR